MSIENYKIAPSILAADFNILGRQIEELEKNGIELLHIDVMDGLFVPSISFGMPLIASIRQESRLFFDVHLMIEKPERYVEDFVISGADSITVHYEACDDLLKIINRVHSLGVECGIAINPETPVESVYPYLSEVDMILTMSVRPGFGGQRFKEEVLEKVEALADIRKEKGLDFQIEIDGGVNKRNLRRIAEKGVDILVAGTAVFDGKISKNLKEMRR